MINGKTVVYCAGSFDILHQNHIRMLERAKSFGDILIVGLNSDELIEQSKGKKPIMTFDQREYVLKSIKYVDIVVPQYNQDQSDRMKNLNVDIFIVGDDWVGKFDYLKNFGITVIYTPYGSTITSTDIKKRIGEEYGEGIK